MEALVYMLFDCGKSMPLIAYGKLFVVVFVVYYYIIFNIEII